jgi:hypothetical protein
VFAAAPLAAWIAYIRWRVGPGGAGTRNFAWPLEAWIGKWTATFAALSTGADLLVWATLLATVGLTVQAAFFLARPRWQERWWRVGAPFVALFLFLGPAVWEGLPGAATRVLLPLNLAFNVLVHRARAPLWWLLAGNLTVAAGLLALEDVPRDPTEISVTLEAWPRRAAAARLEFRVRSLAPRVLIARQHGREIWRASVGADFTPRQSVPLRLPGGRGKIEFETDSPGVPEGPGAGGRLLAFALYDPSLAVEPP